MRRTRGFLPLAGFVVFVLVGAGAAFADPSSPYVPDQVLVRFRPGTPASEVARAHASMHAAIRDEIPQIGVQIVGLPRGLSVGKAIGFYEKNPNVEFVEPDYYSEPTLWPNDPSFTYAQTPLQHMGAPEAWDITTGSSSVPIAVLDTGADFAHPDLQERLVAGWDFVANDADPSDENGHGTCVTGVVGASTNNSLGVAAVDWQNPVLIVRIGNASGYTSASLIAQGVTYAADCGARAINLSTAGTAYSNAEAGAVEYAWAKGAVTIASAGNSADSTPYYPAALPFVVAVSGTDGDALVYYSNYGPWVDVCAPCGSRTTWLGGGIANCGGTSISAPFVTGLFGLVFAANPGLTPQQAVDIVEQTADDLGDSGVDIYFGHGKINMYRAVLAASQTSGGQKDTTAPTVSLASPTGGSALSGTSTIRANASDNVGVTQVEVYLDGSLAGSLDQAPYEWAWDTTQSADGQHVVEAVAYDAAGNVGESGQVFVTVDNSVPEAAIVDPLNGEVVTGTVPVSADGFDAVTCVSEMRFYVDGIWQATRSAAPYVWNWDTTKSSQGWHSVAARAFDAAGNESGSSVTVEVDNPSGPAPVTETFVSAVGFSRKALSQTHAITVLQPGLLSASLTWSGKADLDLYLHSPEGVLVASSTAQGRGGLEEIGCEASAAGVYGLEVVAASGKANYTLVVTHQ